MPKRNKKRGQRPVFEFGKEQARKCMEVVAANILGSPDRYESSSTGDDDDVDPTYMLHKDMDRMDVKMEENRLELDALRTHIHDQEKGLEPRLLKTLEEMANKLRDMEERISSTESKLLEAHSRIELLEQENQQLTSSLTAVVTATKSIAVITAKNSAPSSDLSPTVNRKLATPRTKRLRKSSKTEDPDSPSDNLVEMTTASVATEHLPQKKTSVNKKTAEVVLKGIPVDIKNDELSEFLDAVGLKASKTVRLKNKMSRKPMKMLHATVSGDLSTLPKNAQVRDVSFRVELFNKKKWHPSPHPRKKKKVIDSNPLSTIKEILHHFGGYQKKPAEEERSGPWRAGNKMNFSTVIKVLQLFDGMLNFD